MNFNLALFTFSLCSWELLKAVLGLLSSDRAATGATTAAGAGCFGFFARLDRGPVNKEKKHVNIFSFKFINIAIMNVMIQNVFFNPL